MSAKAELPSIPEELRKRGYQPSGIWTRRSLVLMLGLGVPSAIVIGVVGHYVGHIYVYVAGLVAGWAFMFGAIWVFILRRFGAILTLWLPAILIPLFGYGGALGVSIGLLTWLLCRYQKCRSPTVGAIVGLINAAVGYAAVQIITVLVYGVPRLTSLFDLWLEGDNFPSIAHTVMVPPPAWHFVLVGVDALVFLTLATLVSRWLIAGSPFCELCGKWYDRWRTGSVALELAEPLLQTLTLGSLEPLRADSSSVSENAHLQIGIRRCLGCNTCDFYLGVDIIPSGSGMSEVDSFILGLYAHLRGKMGNPTQWLYAMISPDLGLKLEQWVVAQDNEEEQKAA